MVPHLFMMALKSLLPLDKLTIEDAEFIEIHKTKFFKAAAKAFNMTLLGAIGDQTLAVELTESTFRFSRSELRSTKSSINAKKQLCVGFLVKISGTSALLPSDFSSMPSFSFSIRSNVSKDLSATNYLEVFGMFMMSSGVYSGGVQRPNPNYFLWLEDPLDLDTGKADLTFRGQFFADSLNVPLVAPATFAVSLTMVPIVVEEAPEFNMDNIVKLFKSTG